MSPVATGVTVRFAPVEGDRTALGDEGERLVRFLAEPQGAETFDIRFA